LLSDQAEIDAQPVLEIHADEVQAAHGATVGGLDPTALFYLRSRGLPADEARKLLTTAFVRDCCPASMPPCARPPKARWTARSPPHWSGRMSTVASPAGLDWARVRADFPLAAPRGARQAAWCISIRQHRQKPAAVIETVDAFYRRHNANVSRACIRSAWRRRRRTKDARAARAASQCRVGGPRPHRAGRRSR
jgi:hypothetical protein